MVDEGAPERSSEEEDALSRTTKRAKGTESEEAVMDDPMIEAEGETRRVVKTDLGCQSSDSEGLPGTGNTMKAKSPGEDKMDSGEPKGKQASSYKDKLLIMEITELMAEEWEVRISHIYREHNSVADWLAKEALKYGWRETEIRVTPAACHQIVATDVEGAPPSL